ncbi:hypothetical protein PG996_008198 [Apiospora saccharicola]|uniref:Uncharacterized protein n=1 Tax=Apiospora saccharicola TaxID=335842 RepID=A0ABR1UZR6_9PEZI
MLFDANQRALIGERYLRTIMDEFLEMESRTLAFRAWDEIPIRLPMRWDAAMFRNVLGEVYLRARARG